MSDPGRLFIVATPIGNLEDITLRALRTLREADLIAAEDTRRTRKLLAHYDIHTRLRSYHSHNIAQTAPPILDAVAQGQAVALVTDAGLPGVSDPGREIIAMARERGLPVEIVPGPSAVVTAFVSAAFPGEGFVFVGYLPSRDADRRRVLAELRGAQRAAVAFEAPHRLRRSLRDIAALLGEEQRVAVVREMTKVHEETFVGSAREAAEHYSAGEPKGEVTLVIGPAAPAEGGADDHSAVRDLAAALVAMGLPPSAVARLLAEHLHVRRGVLYEQLKADRRPQTVDLRPETRD
jgi:16S rRNA (cytidine1402-2'-O)-methyltransferase